jgi:hypothetical protein
MILKETERLILRLAYLSATPYRPDRIQTRVYRGF